MFCRNSNITRKTKTIASAKVFTTSSIEIPTKVELSYGTFECTPAGKYGSNCANFALTAWDEANALPSLVNCIPRPTAGLPFSRAEVAYDCEPSSIRATSCKRTTEPSVLARSTILLN